jgi:hypothetical protein
VTHDGSGIARNAKNPKYQHITASSVSKYPALCIKRTNNLADFSARVNHLWAMQDKSINGALLALRKRIIRGDLDGLAHVQALLVLRGEDMPAVLPAKRPDAARRGHMALIVLSALRSGANTQATVAGYVSTKRPELTPEAAYKRASMCLAKLQRKGLVRREGRVWRLAQ